MQLDIVKAIELAITHEMEARRRYLSLAEETEDLELKHLLQEIAQEEAGHEASLRSRLRLYEQRRLLRETLNRYLCPAMIEEILKNPELMQLGGQRRHLTVMFADLKGFTRLAERLDPAGVVEVLNRFFTVMVDVVFHYQGTLDKFLGDGLMAIFGAPLTIPRAARQAVACAIAMQQRLPLLKQEGLPLEGMRIGINTGEAIVGNVGSEKRMEFTVIGDVVNVASRLLEVAREQEAPIVVGEATYREVKGEFPLEPGPTVVLRGRQEPTVCYVVSPSALS